MGAAGKALYDLLLLNLGLPDSDDAGVSTQCVPTLGPTTHRIAKLLKEIMYNLFGELNDNLQKGHYSRPFHRRNMKGF